MGGIQLRIVSALLMSVLLAVPALGAVCSMLCEPDAGMRAHRSHAAGVHQTAAAEAADDQVGGHLHADSKSVDVTASHHHHAAALPPATEAPHSTAEWNGRCCDQPTLMLAAVTVVRHELQIDPAVVGGTSFVLSGSSARPAGLSRITARGPSLSSQTNPVLRV